MNFVPYIADEAWEIDKRELTLGRELGSGQFGVRYKFVLICVLCNSCSYFGD